MENQECHLGEEYPTLDYYNILGVERNASNNDIQRAFRGLATIFHPDKFTDPDMKQLAQNRFTEIKSAYENLNDNERRRLYDAYGSVMLEKMKSMQITTLNKTDDEISRDLYRLQQRHNMSYIQHRVDLKGSFISLVDASNLSRQRLPNIQTVSLKQGFHLPLFNDKARLKLFLQSMVTRNHQGSAQMIAKYSHLLPHQLVANAKMKLAWQQIGARIGLQSSACLGSTQALSLGWEPFLGPSMRLGLTSHISPTWLGIAQIQFGSVPSIKLEVIGQPEKVENWTTSFRCKSSVNNVSLSSRFQCKLSKRANLALEVGASSFVNVSTNSKLTVFQDAQQFDIVKSWFIVGHYERTISQLSKAHIGFTISSNGVYLSMGISRLGQTVAFPIMIRDTPSLISALIAAIGPLFVAYCVQALILEPRRQIKRNAKQELLRKRRAEQIVDSQRRAELDRLLIKEETARRQDFEEERGGLVIVQGFYGRLPPPESATNPLNSEIGEDDLNSTSFNEQTEGVLDITLPLQYLVQNSKLLISTDCDKTSLLGFYDPCPDQDKWIEIVYMFRNKIHRCLLPDSDMLALPLQSHRVEIDEK